MGGKAVGAAVLGVAGSLSAVKIAASAVVGTTTGNIGETTGVEIALVLALLGVAVTVAMKFQKMQDKIEFIYRDLKNQKRVCAERHHGKPVRESEEPEED